MTEQNHPKLSLLVGRALLEPVVTLLAGGRHEVMADRLTDQPARPVGLAVLASYPRSGSTWLMSMIERVVEAADAPIDVSSGADRVILERWSGVDVALVPPEDIDLVRRAVWTDIAVHQENERRLVLSKVHDPMTKPGPLPVEHLRAAIYIVRAVDDVAASLMPFMGFSLDETLQFLDDPDAALAGSSTPQVRHQLGRWADHVLSWLDAPCPTTVVRYEDLIVQPVAELVRVSEALGIDVDVSAIEAVVEEHAFARMQAGEQRRPGALVPSQGSGQFHRRGRPGGGNEELGSEIAAGLRDANQTVLARLGYTTST